MATKIWTHKKAKYIAIIIGVAQLIIVAYLAIISWQAAELYGDDSLISKGLGRGYSYMYILYAMGLITTIKFHKFGLTVSAIAGFLLFILAIKFSKLTVIAALSMQYYLLPVTLLLSFLIFRYKNTDTL